MSLVWPASVPQAHFPCRTGVTWFLDYVNSGNGQNCQMYKYLLLTCLKGRRPKFHEFCENWDLQIFHGSHLVNKTMNWILDARQWIFGHHTGDTKETPRRHPGVNGSSGTAPAVLSGLRSWELGRTVRTPTAEDCWANPVCVGLLKPEAFAQTQKY